MNYNDELQLFINTKWLVLMNNNLQEVAKEIDDLAIKAGECTTNLLALVDYINSLTDLSL